MGLSVLPSNLHTAELHSTNAGRMAKKPDPPAPRCASLHITLFMLTKYVLPPSSVKEAPRAAKPTAQDELDCWFVEKVLPLEPLLLSYLRRNMAAIQCHEPADLRQETYIRVYEAATVARPENPRAFVLGIARNLLIDHARRAKIVSIEAMEDIDSFAMEDRLPNPEETMCGRQALRIFAQALDNLPPGCRRVVELRKIDGMSQKEVAQHLGIAEGTVEKQVSKGMRSLTDFLLSQGIDLGRGFFSERAIKRNGKR